MTYADVVGSVSGSPSSRPLIASYDVGYEFSQAHYIALQCMVEDADEEPAPARAPHQETVAA